MRRRDFLRAAGVTLSVCGAALALNACSRSPGANAGVVVLYASADDVFARRAADAFEAQTGVRVELIGDTEATKTTGLVTRLLAEKDHPRADVWWSSEAMGTILLDESGALEAGGMEGAVPADWPTRLVGPGWNWVGFAERGRVIAYSTDRVTTPPTTLNELAAPGWKGRVGMARPQFGTTRGHVALLALRWGVDGLEAWLEAMEANGLRLYDGNARVVRAIYEGEIDVGLTDTDDAWAAVDNRWPVAMTFEHASGAPPWPSAGPTTIPNTVAVVRGCPHPEQARALARFLVSEQIERLLAESASRNIPVHPALRAEFSGLAPPDLSDRPDYGGAAPLVPQAMDACERVLISP